MQQKHKKKHNARPIVSKHAAAPHGAKSTASTTQHQQQKDKQCQQHQQHFGQNKEHPTNGITQQAKVKSSSVLGKRQHAAQQQGSTTSKPPQQPHHTGVSIQQQGQHNKKQKLQDMWQAGNSLKQLTRPQPQQQQQQEGNDKPHHHSGNKRHSAAYRKDQQPRQACKQQTELQELQQPKQHQPDSQQQQQQHLSKQPAQQTAKHPQQHGRKQKHSEQLTTSSRPAPVASAQTNGTCINTAGPLESPCSAAAVPATGPGCAGPAAAASAAAAPTVPMASSKPWHPKQPNVIGSNWQALQQQLKEQAAAQPRWTRKRKDPAAGHPPATNGGSSSSSKKQISALGHNQAVTPIVAMDCEMVGVGPGGERDSLARVSIVNASGNVLYDSYVGQKEPVSDYRTWVSGVSPANLVGAPDISTVQKQVTELLQGRVLVGHGLKKDLSVLMLSHPRKNIRDTAKYPPFTFSKGGKRRPRALKQLAQQELGLSIQEGQHSSIDDARAALYLYQKHAGIWEKALKTHQGMKQLPTANRPVKKRRVESYSHRDVKDDPLADL